MNWFKRRGSNDSDTTTHFPELPTSIQYNGDHHISYNVARNRLKKAITEFYRSLELLKSYKTLNLSGFQKILKKFDKVLIGYTFFKLALLTHIFIKTAGWKASSLYTHKINKYHWVKSHKIDDILRDTEVIF